MDKPRFTPAPWHMETFGKCEGAVVGSDGEMVCDPSGMGREEEEEIANAQLIACVPDFYEDEEKKLAYLKILKGNILSIGNELRCGKGTLDMEMTLKYAVQSIDIIISETEKLLAQARGETGQRLGGAK